MGKKIKYLKPKPHRKDVIYAYTDGSSYNSKRRGGMGVRILYLDEKELEITEDLDIDGVHGATNNQMELQAVTEALKHLADYDVYADFSSIEVRTDSRYVVDNLPLAKYTWPNNKWCNFEGRPVENVRYWKGLIKQIKACNASVNIEWVKGHKGDIHNSAVDKLAKKSANGYLQKSKTVTTLGRNTTKFSTTIGSVEMLGQSIRIRIIETRYMREQKLFWYRYQVTSPKSKFYDLVDIVFSKDGSMRRQLEYKVSFNKNTNNPMVLKVLEEVNHPEKSSHPKFI